MNGLQPRPDFSAVSFNLLPGLGEYFVFPALTTSGPCDIMVFEGVPGGPLEFGAQVTRPVEGGPQCGLPFDRQRLHPVRRLQLGPGHRRSETAPAPGRDLLAEADHLELLFPLEALDDEVELRLRQVETVVDLPPPDRVLEPFPVEVSARRLAGVDGIQPRRRALPDPVVRR